MKKFLLIIFIFFYYTETIISNFTQTTFNGNAPHIVNLGEQFYINYILNTTGEQVENPILLKVNGFKILNGPYISAKSSSTTIINGNIFTKLQIIFTYSLIAEKEGKFIIPAASIKVGSNKYKSKDLKIKVLSYKKNDKFFDSKQQVRTKYQLKNQLANENIFLETQVSKLSVYENEGFLVTFKLYSSMEFEVENIKFPDFEGFITQEIDIPENNILIENYNGINYRTVILKKAILYPQHTGKISIGKAICNVIARVQNNESQDLHSIFDDFFDTYSDMKKKLISSPITIDVKALPHNCPSNFSGAVGKYQIISSINTINSKVNEPVTIEIILSGEGNIKLIKNPIIIFPNNFETYDPKIEVQTKISTQGIVGTKRIEYCFVPRYAGNYKIPSIQFSFFNPKTKLYSTISTKGYSLHIIPNKNSSEFKIIFPTTIRNKIKKESIHFIGRDIHHIKLNGFFFEKKNIFFGSFGYWFCYFPSCILFLALLVDYYKKKHENSNINLTKTKNSYKTALKRLKVAKLYLKKNQKDYFYENILKSVLDYLRDKWNIPTSNLTQENIKEELTRCGIQKQLIENFIFIIHTSEFARYGPIQNEVIMDELYQKTMEAIQKIEKYNSTKNEKIFY